MITCEDIRTLAAEGKHIALIKELRAVSGMGLKDSKDAVEMCYASQSQNGHDKPRVYNVDKLLEMFISHGVEPEVYPFEKEEFLNLLGDAIDGMDALYFDDMLDAVLATCENIKRRGGLQVVAKERARFLHSI